MRQRKTTLNYTAQCRSVNVKGLGIFVESEVCEQLFFS